MTCPSNSELSVDSGGDDSVICEGESDSEASVTDTVTGMW